MNSTGTPKIMTIFQDKDGTYIAIDLSQVVSYIADVTNKKRVKFLYYNGQFEIFEFSTRDEKKRFTTQLVYDLNTLSIQNLSNLAFQYKPI